MPLIVRKTVSVFFVIWMTVPLVAQMQVQEQHVTVDAALVVHHMQGGIGASWHAMSLEIPLENEKYDYPVRLTNNRGSSYGANPPLWDTAAWNQVFYYAKWLGLNFIRVELSQRMYEPERKKFDWSNEEMQALYRILDWCEINHADVFLQQMWGHVEWNAYPGVHPLLSAPRSLDDYADGIATLLHYLTVTRKYTCIKYFCITNEPPGGTWGYWWSYGVNTVPLRDAWRTVRETLDKRGIDVPLSGPDWTSLPPFDSTKIDFNDFLGAYDIHSYGGIDYEGEEIIANWANWAHGHHKPFFLSEFGNMNMGWGGTDPGPKSFAASLSNASDAVRCLNLGTDALNRWSFVNRGDLDGQWQLIRTWDIGTKKHLRNIAIEPEAYYGYAMLTRFMGKYPDLIFWQTDRCIDGVKLTAYRNQDKSISVLLVNNEKRPIRVKISFGEPEDKMNFNLYQVNESLLKQPGFQLNPQPVDHPDQQPRMIVLLPESISLLTTLNLRSGDPGKIE